MNTIILCQFVRYSGINNVNWVKISILYFKFSRIKILDFYLASTFLKLYLLLTVTKLKLVTNVNKHVIYSLILTKVSD